MNVLRFARCSNIIDYVSSVTRAIRLAQYGAKTRTHSSIHMHLAKNRLNQSADEK